MNNINKESEIFTPSTNFNAGIQIENSGLKLSDSIKLVGDKVNVAIVKNRESLREDSIYLSNEVIFWDEQSLETKVEILGMLSYLTTGNVTVYTTRDAIDGIVSEDMIHKVEDLI